MPSQPLRCRDEGLTISLAAGARRGLFLQREGGWLFRHEHKNTHAFNRQSSSSWPNYNIRQLKSTRTSVSILLHVYVRYLFNFVILTRQAPAIPSDSLS